MADPYIREFGLKQPPLIQQLRKILYDYQDDALLKEIIQNADDAGATEMKIVYDGRRINRRCDERLPFRKFFQGPGLCVYNNEIFKEKDWEGVTSINTSVKENDLLKVGRFGLGFKSIFHLTDHPCIISDNQILLIDPFQEEKGGKVCAIVNLSDVQNCQLFSVEDILLALDGLFGVSKSVFEDGKYPGTIFWFPLRDRPSALSDTLYDQHKVESLLKSLQIESTNNLLFLKYLERLEIYIRGKRMDITSFQGEEDVVNVQDLISDAAGETIESTYSRIGATEGTVLELVFKLEVVDDKKMLEKRKRFIRHIEKLDEHANSDIVCDYNISFNVSVKMPGSTEFDTRAETWMVLNLFKVTDMSPGLANLTKMLSLSYRPYVSVATPLKLDNKPFRGHVFCFLPLPQEPKSLTGLPVHLNAFFALSQNRRQIKWPSADQEECDMHNDRDLVWNQLLTSELLPYAYALLLRRIVSCGEENVGCSKEIAHTLYRSIPDVDMIERRLINLAKCLFSLIVNDNIFFTANNGGRWISHSEAIFINFDEFSEYDVSSISRSVVKVLVSYNNNYVQLPEHVQRSLSKFMRFKYFAPEDLSRLLLENQQYKRLSPEDKLNLLKYFFCHKSYTFLKGLELLPLKDGSFTKFSSDLRRVSPIYILDEDTMDLFPGLESKFLLPSVSSIMKEHFKVMMKTKYFQVSPLTEETVACLVENSIRLNTRIYEEKVKISGKCFGESWMRKIWKFILNKNCIGLFENIPVVPIYEERNLEIELIRLTDKLIVKEVPGILHPLPHGVCEALSHLSITVLTTFPSWLSLDALKMYLYFPTSSSFLKLLDRIHAEMQRKGNGTVLEDFNKNCPMAARKELVQYLGKLEESSWTVNSRALVRQFKLFTEAHSCRTSHKEDQFLVSLTENDKLTQATNIPVRLPYPIIVATPDEARLALHIGVQELDPVRIIIDILRNVKQGKYSKEEVNIFLLFIFDNFVLYQNDGDILQYLKTIPFLKSRMNSSDCKLEDLFDPRPSHLQQLFLMEDKFPKTFCEEPYIGILRRLGLKVDVTFDDLIETAKVLDHLSSANNLKEIIQVKVKAFMQMMEKRIRESYGAVKPRRSSLENLKCIPWIKHKPNGFPNMLPWFKMNTTLCRPTEVLSDMHIHLVGSVMPLVNCSNYTMFANSFQWNRSPPLERVLKQLETIVTTYEIHAEEASTGLLEIYKYLNEIVLNDASSKDKIRYLQNSRCLFVNSKLMKPSEVVRHLDHNCSPYLHSLDQTEVRAYIHFLDTVGVKENCDIKDVINALKRMRKTQTQMKGQIARLSAVDLQLGINLLMTLKDTMVAENVTYEDLDACHKSELYAPDTDCILRQTSDLCLNDLDDGPDAKIHFVHKMVSQDLATHIGIQTRRTRIYEINSIGIDFGQEEELVTRINNLLSSYPRDTGIMKELLQNADDAGATEVHFVKDYRHHSCKRVFEEKHTPIQGPALCVYSDSSFTEEDITGIQKLGLGSKRYDPSKIGQYGIGFNSVYHITDIPSFITKDPQYYSGGILCIFDPLCKYVPHATKQKPGRRFTVRDIEMYYPDILLAYDRDLIKSERATMFRFPLRTAEMAKVSKITNQGMTTQQMDEMLTNVRKEMAECLLFLKNVTKVTLENITSGTREIEYSVNVSLSREDHAKRRLFAGYIEEFGRQEKLIFTMEPRQVEYNLSITDSCGMENSYCVVQRIGFGFSENDIPDLLKEALNKGMLYNLPIGGVAVPQNVVKGWKNGRKVTGRQSSYLNHSANGKAFCFLPLAIETGLPLHINGHFVLDQGSRRCLWNEIYGFSKMFNETVLERAVAPAYVTALERMKSSICEEESSIEENACRLHEMLDRFHKLFPIFSSAKEDYWKFLVKMTYQSIKNKKHKLFAVVIPENLRGPGSPPLEMKWVSLDNDENFNRPCFNGLSKLSWRDHQPLTRLLKKLGLNLLDTPIYIYDSMHKTDVQVRMIEPCIVSEFLRSYKNNSSERCKINNVSALSLQISGINVTMTTIESVSNVNLLLKYLKETKPFDLDGLPLLVTEDGFLREFSKSSPVFLSKYCNLFKKSGDKFVHHLQVEGEVDAFLENPKANSEESVIGIFPHITVLDKSPFNVFKVLRPADVPKLLTLSLDSIFHSGDTVQWNKKLLSEEWIERFWHMICEMSSVTKEGGRSDVDPDEFCKITAVLGNFSLLPVRSDDQYSYLLPINKGYQIVDTCSFQTGSDLRKALEKIRFLRIDSNALLNKLVSGTKFDVVSAVRYLMSSDKRPGKVLKFLEDSKNRLFCLTDEECESILTFISGNWEEMSRSESFQEIYQRLIVLPLFSTYDGKRASLVNKETVLVLYPPAWIPPEGITEWTAGTNICIIQGHKCFVEMLRRHGVQIKDVFFLYQNYILDTFELIPHGRRIKHLEYIRDDLLKKAPGSEYSQFQWHLIMKLRASACLPVNQELKKVSDFYNPENEVFMLFCRDHEILPAEYCSKKWLPFLKTCGLISIITDDDLIELAIQMEHHICASPQFDLNRKSRVLVQELLRRMSENSQSPNSRMEEKVWSRETKSKISRIKFITPHTVSDFHSSIHIQHIAESTLISFSGAVSSEHESSCWTSMNLLPSWACPKDPDSFKELGIYIDPPQEAVVQHLINICGSEAANTINTELMDTVYGCLDSFDDLGSHVDKLSEACIIHIPDDKIFVKTNQIVLESNIADLRPYLFKAPIEYGKYHNTLFRKLGIQERPSFHNFVKIFHQMKADGFEVSILKRIIHTMTVLKPSYTEVKDVLYLPNRNFELVNSKDLIISNTPYLENRLGNEHNFQFFVELQDLGINIQSIKYFLDCLPMDLRPLLLSTIVREQVDEEEIVITSSTLADRIEDHIHSQEFLRGILRLANHVRGKQGNELSELESIDMVRNIQNTSIVAVKGLKSRLVFNDEILPNTEEEKICFYKKKDGYGYVLYILADISEAGLYSVLAEHGGLTNLIDECTKDILENNFQYIHALFENIDMPQKIHRNLDRSRIESYEITENIAKMMLPRPGTYLSKKMLPFLNHGLTTFSVKEPVPVVLEVCDPVLEMNVEDVSRVGESRYIYCRVLNQVASAKFEGLPGSEEYAVDIDGLDKLTLTAHGFKLFKILPDCRQSTLDDWKTLAQPERRRMLLILLNQMWNLTEIDRRRVIKRLWLHWDQRDQDGEEEFYCEMRTFLEEKLFDDDADELLDDSNFQNPKHGNDKKATQKWFELFKTLESGVPKKTSEYGIAWANQLQNRGQPIHDRKRGVMWLQQATTDQMAAERFFPMAGEVAEGFSTYHWICYMCHQGAEKALKAAWYFKDAREAGSHGHQLQGFSNGLGSDIETVTRKLENLLHHHTRMRYPDDFGIMIPAKDPAYSRESAELAKQYAKTIINYVESNSENNMSENDEDSE